MDLIFRFGSHYYENGDSSFWIQVFVSFIGAFFGFGFALAAYYYQTRKDKLKEIKKEIKDSDDKLSYYNLLIKNIIIALQTQKKEIIEFTKLQKKNQMEPLVLKKIASKDFIRLQSIDSKGIFEAFGVRLSKDPNWINYYLDLNSNLDYLEALSTEINNQNDSYNEYVNSCIEEISRLIEFISMGLKTLIAPYNNNETCIFANKHLESYNEMIGRNATIIEFELKFINPMHQELLSEKNKYQFDEEFISYCEKAEKHFNELKFYINDYLMGLEKSVEVIDEHLISVKKVNDKIENIP